MVIPTISAHLKTHSFAILILIPTEVSTISPLKWLILAIAVHKLPKTVWFSFVPLLPPNLIMLLSRVVLVQLGHLQIARVFPFLKLKNSLGFSMMEVLIQAIGQIHLTNTQKTEIFTPNWQLPISTVAPIPF